MNLKVVSVTTLALDGFLFNPQQKVNEMKMNRTFFFGINNEEINASIIFQTDLFNIINISFLYLLARHPVIIKALQIPFSL